MPTKVKGTTGVDKIESGAVITNPAFSGNATVSGSLTVGGVNVFSGPYRNLIINGDMNIAQRGTSSTGITSSGYYTVDRFNFYEATDGTYTMSQDTDVPSGQGFSNSIKINTTTADTSITGSQSLRLRHHIEGQNLQHLKYGTSSAESITLSFWVKSNLTGNAVARIAQPYSGGTDQIGSLVTINSANTWEKKTITFIGNTSNAIINDNSSGIIVEVYFSAGPDISSGTLPSTWTTYALADVAVGQTIDLASSTSNYINITGVQLEVGEGASDFEFLPYDVQLQRCERYFEMSYSQGTALGTVTQDGAEMWLANRNPGLPHHYLKFRVIKRINPGITIYNSGSGATGSFSNLDTATSPPAVTSRIGHKGSTIYTTTSTGLGEFLQFHYTADAEL